MSFTKSQEYLNDIAEYGDNKGKIVSLSLFTIFIILVLMRVTIINIWQEEQITPNLILHDTGNTYFIIKNLPYSDASYFGSDLLVYENDSILGPGQAQPNIIREIGRGRYSHYHNYVFFSTSDNTDPRTNKRIYTIKYPWAPNNILLLLFGFLCFLLNFVRLRKSLIIIQNLHPVWIVSILITCAAIFRIYIATNMWDSTVYGMQVKGLQFSDAAGWFKLAVNYLHGQNYYETIQYWDARRHGYAWFLSAVLSIFGESVSPIRIFQIFFSIISTGLIFDACRRILPFWIAILATMLHLFLEFDALVALLTMSETLGYFLTNLSLWMLIIGILAIKNSSTSRITIWLFFVSGVTLAFSNLVRPLNLMSAFPLTLLIMWYLSSGEGTIIKRYSRGLRPLAIFLLGLIIVISPWLVRQKLNYDFYAITDNSVEMLYAATTPKFGFWSFAVTVYTESTNPEIKYDITKRYQFFKKGANENLSSNFGWYIGHLLTFSLKHAKRIGVPKWVLLCALVIFVLSAGINNNSSLKLKSTVIVAAMFTFICYIPDTWYSYITVFLLLAGLITALVKRHPVSVLGLVILMTVISLGIMATPPEIRFYYSLIWLSGALSIWFLWTSLEFVSDEKFSINNSSKQPNFIIPYIQKSTILLVSVIIMLLLLGSVKTIFVHYFPKEIERSHVSPNKEASLIDDFLLQSDATSFHKWKSKLMVFKTTLREDFTITIDVNENVGNRNQLFASRPYPFSLSYAFPPIELNEISDLAVIIPQAINSRQVEFDKAYYFVGVYHQQRFGPTLEIVGFTLADSLAGTLNWTIPVFENKHEKYISSWNN